MSIEDREKIDITYHLFACNSIGEVATGTFGAMDAKSAVEELMKWVIPALIAELEEYPSNMVSLIIDASETEHSGGMLIHPSHMELPLKITCGRRGCETKLGSLGIYGAELKCPKCDLVHVIYEGKEPNGVI